MKLLFITAPYCGACKVIKAEQLDSLAKKIGWDNVLEVDGMKNFGIAKQYGVTKVPTTVVVEGAEVLYRSIGRIDTEAVEKLFTPEKPKKNRKEKAMPEPEEVEDDTVGELEGQA